VAGREAHHARELDTFAALTVPTMRPLACYAASDLGYPLKAQSAATEKGAKRAMHAELLRLAPPVAAALLWRRRLAHKHHRNPQTNWRFASMGSSWDWPSNRRKEERGGGWQTRLNAASIVVEQSGNERGCLDHIHCHAVLLSAKFLLFLATVGIRLTLETHWGRIDTGRASRLVQKTGARIRPCWRPCGRGRQHGVRSQDASGY
jgi:hypothetical protein